MFKYSFYSGMPGKNLKLSTLYYNRGDSSSCAPIGNHIAYHMENLISSKKLLTMKTLKKQITFGKCSNYYKISF